MTTNPDELKVSFYTLLGEYHEALAACRTAQDQGLTGAEEYGRAQVLLRQVEMAGNDLATALERALEETSKVEG